MINLGKKLDLKTDDFSEIGIKANDLIQIYLKSGTTVIEGTFLLKSDLTVFCKTPQGLMEIPVREIERIVRVVPMSL